VWFSLSVPCDSRYLETVHDLVARVAEQVGYDSPTSSGIAISIHAALQAVVGRVASAGQGAVFDVRFSTGDMWFEVTIRMSGCQGVPETALSSYWGDVSAGAMDRVENERQDGTCVCRMSKHLPPRG
jgi:hypothetical protein